MYGIIKRSTKEVFAGFDSDGSPLWTENKDKAWVATKLEAECQALFLVNSGSQKKPVKIN